MARSSRSSGPLRVGHGTAMERARLRPDWVPFRCPIDQKEAGGGKGYEVRLPTADLKYISWQMKAVRGVTRDGGEVERG